MIKRTKLTLLLAFGLIVLGVSSISVRAEQESGRTSSGAEMERQVAPSDEMSEILRYYFAMRDSLAHDKTDGVNEQARQMSRRLDGLIRSLQVMQAASDGLKADDLTEAREGFGPLSEAVLAHVRQFGLAGEAYSFHCSMMDQGWLQEHDRIGNPYYGSEMLKCGEITGKVQEGRFIEATEGRSEVRIYEVFGMDCPGCHGAIEKLVKKIPAVQEAEANWKEQRLTLTLRPGSELDDDDVHEAIRRANFTPGKRKQ
jgi:copper chaperone CopZ